MIIIEHYACFKSNLDRLDESAWEQLRNSTEKDEKPYAIEENIEEFEKNCERIPVYKEAAKLICGILEQENIKSVVSMGCGKGILEWHIKKISPEINVECTDFVESAMKKLKDVFVSCDKFSTFDMKNGDYSVFSPDKVLLFFRVSTELSYEEWCQAFKNMKNAGIKNIIFVPESIATPELRDKYEKMHIVNQAKGKKETFCGWIYSKDVLSSMFESAGYSILREDALMDTVLYLLG